MIAAAQTFAPLAGVGVSTYPMPQGSPLPWITLQVISDAPVYVNNARLATSWTRVQALIFGGGQDTEQSQNVLSAWQAFLDSTTFDGTIGTTISANMSKGATELGIVNTQPMTFQIRADCMVRNNELL